MRWLLVLLALFLAFTCWTAITQVQPGERIVVRRFGRILEEKTGPGLFIGLPWGLDRIDRVQVSRDRQIVVGSADPEADDAAFKGQLLTGDHNLVNVRVEVFYNVRDAEVERFVLHADQADGLVSRVVESALAEWVAGRDVDTVLLRGKAVLPTWLVREVQSRLEPYGLGIDVQVASVTHLFPPAEVREAFERVARAQTEISTQVFRAEREADQKFRQAQAEKFRGERLTAAYANDQKLQAQAESENYLKRLEQYRHLRQENPNYLASLWWDEIGRLFARMRENGRIDLLDHHLAGDGLNITQFPPLPRKK